MSRSDQIGVRRVFDQQDAQFVLHGPSFAQIGCGANSILELQRKVKVAPWPTAPSAHTWPPVPRNNVARWRARYRTSNGRRMESLNALNNLWACAMSKPAPLSRTNIAVVPSCVAVPSEMRGCGAFWVNFQAFSSRFSSTRSRGSLLTRCRPVFRLQRRAPRHAPISASIERASWLKSTCAGLV